MSVISDYSHECAEDFIAHKRYDIGAFIGQLQDVGGAKNFLYLREPSIAMRTMPDDIRNETDGIPRLMVVQVFPSRDHQQRIRTVAIDQTARVSSEETYNIINHADVEHPEEALIEKVFYGHAVKDQTNQEDVVARIVIDEDRRIDDGGKIKLTDLNREFEPLLIEVRDILRRNPKIDKNYAATVSHMQSSLETLLHGKESAAVAPIEELVVPPNGVEGSVIPTAAAPFIHEDHPLAPLLAQAKVESWGNETDFIIKLAEPAPNVTALREKLDDIAAVIRNEYGPHYYNRISIVHDSIRISDTADDLKKLLTAQLRRPIPIPADHETFSTAEKPKERSVPVSRSPSLSTVHPTLLKLALDPEEVRRSTQFMKSVRLSEYIKTTPRVEEKFDSSWLQHTHLGFKRTSGDMVTNFTVIVDPQPGDNADDLKKRTHDLCERIKHASPGEIGVSRIVADNKFLLQRVSGELQKKLQEMRVRQKNEKLRQDSQEQQQRLQEKQQIISDRQVLLLKKQENKRERQEQRLQKQQQIKRKLEERLQKAEHKRQSKNTIQKTPEPQISDEHLFRNVQVVRSMFSIPEANDFAIILPIGESADGSQLQVRRTALRNEIKNTYPGEADLVGLSTTNRAKINVFGARGRLLSWLEHVLQHPDSPDIQPAKDPVLIAREPAVNKIEKTDDVQR